MLRDLECAFSFTAISILEWYNNIPHLFFTNTATHIMFHTHLQQL